MKPMWIVLVDRNPSPEPKVFLSTEMQRLFDFIVTLTKADTRFHVYQIEQIKSLGKF
jgi:hypothetical protein